jgi:small-conductance mechanosensitive channel
LTWAHRPHEAGRVQRPLFVPIAGIRLRRLVLALALAALLLDTGGAAAQPAAGGEAPVRLLDRTVFVVHVPRGDHSAEVRARAATQVLEQAAQKEEVPEIRVSVEGGVAVVLVGTSPLIQLWPEDAAAAGDASLDVHAGAVAGKVRDVLTRERSRSRVAQVVFSFSLVVFSGLVATLLLRKVREIVQKARGWVAQHPESLPVLRVGGIEVLRPAAFKGAIWVALGGARVLVQVGIFITWVGFSLSLFAATRGYSERLTGFVIAPISALMGRLAGGLPVLVIAMVATLAVVLLVRFVGLFFGSVARGETSLGWLPSDLAAPTGVLVQSGIVIAFLVLAAPLVTGAEEGALGRAGLVAMISLGLASTPILASAAVGVAVVYGRHVRVGDVAMVGGRSGRVREVTLLDIRLEDEDGCDVRVPHLLSLIHPTRVIGQSALVTVEISVAPGADIAHAREILLVAASGIGTRTRTALIGLDDRGAHLRATLESNAKDARSRWLAAIAEGLAAASIPLGRPQ